MILFLLMKIKIIKMVMTLLIPLIWRCIIMNNDDTATIDQSYHNDATDSNVDVLLISNIKRLVMTMLLTF